MKRRSNLLTILGVLAPLFLLLIADFLIGDYQFFMLINQVIANPILDCGCAYISPVLFSGLYALTLMALCFSSNGMSKATGILSMTNGALSYGTGSLIKLLVQRPRPEILAATRVISEARIIGLWHESTFSFPSTTTMLAFGLALPILLEKRRIGGILVALSYFMGFAVVYTGFHFPLDVAAGAFFALAITICTNWLKKPLARLVQTHRPESFEGAE